MGFLVWMGGGLSNLRIYNPDTDCNRRNSFPDGSS